MLEKLINKILENHAGMQINLSSKSARENIAEDIARQLKRKYTMVLKSDVEIQQDTSYELKTTRY